MIYFQMEFNAADDENKASQASTLYATACRHFHHAATILTALTGQSNDENVFPSYFYIILLDLTNVSCLELQVTSLIRVCKTNCVVMRLLAGGHRREGACGPLFDFTVHPHLPIVKVT